MFIFIIPSVPFEKKSIALSIKAAYSGTTLSLWVAKRPEQRIDVKPGEHILVHPTKTAIKMKSPKDRLAKYGWRTGFYHSTRLDSIEKLGQVAQAEKADFIAMASGQAGISYFVKDGKVIPHKWFADQRTKPLAFKRMLEDVFGKGVCNASTAQ